jgi:hypothetical protein
LNDFKVFTHKGPFIIPWTISINQKVYGNF